MFVISLGYCYASDNEERKKLVIKRDYQLRECGITVPVREDDDPYSGDYNNVIATADQLVNMTVAKIPFTVINEANLEQEPSAMMDSITKALSKIDQFFNKTGRDIEQWNSRVEVHMPGQALSMYNRTMLLTDSCTDGLQEELEKGWRITACCPQPDQRRPDYILGRFDPDPAYTGRGAERGSNRMPTDVPVSNTYEPAQPHWATPMDVPVGILIPESTLMPTNSPLLELIRQQQKPLEQPDVDNLNF